MTTMTFDTLKFVHHLRESGIPEPHAEAIAEACRDAQQQTGATDDGKDERLDLKIELLRAELKETELRLNHSIQLIGLDTRDLEYRLTIKLGTLITLASGVIIAALKLA